MAEDIKVFGCVSVDTGFSLADYIIRSTLIDKTVFYENFRNKNLSF